MFLCDWVSSVRQNVLAFLADLFYILEVRPAKCIRPPGLMRDRFPVNEGKKHKKKSLGQFSVTLSPFFLFFLSSQNRQKKCGHIIGVLYFVSVLVAAGVFCFFLFLLVFIVYFVSGFFF